MSRSTLPIISIKPKKTTSLAVLNIDKKVLKKSWSPVKNDPFQVRPSRNGGNRASLNYHPESVGVSAKLDFVNIYKNRIKVTERNSFERLEYSPSEAYLERIDEKNLTPMPFGIVKISGKDCDFDVHGMSMGDNYAQAISEGIKHKSIIEKLNLKDNRLSEKGMTSILTKLSTKKIKYLCLSDNPMSLNVVKTITGILSNPKTCLKELILENMKITDTFAVMIFHSIATNTSLTKLCMARNSITEISCKSLKDLLEKNSSLKKLDLHWNQLKGPGISLIFLGLSKNNRLSELDLSWNLMSRHLDGLEIAKITQVLPELKVKHLDLSSNYLTVSQCEFLAEGLKKNNKILGIHMNGNDCRVDSKGFLRPDAYVNKLKYGHIQRRLLKDTKKAFETNCWICEGWVETTFVWTGEPNEPVCIHLECDEFQPDLMKRSQNRYEITRTVPPGKVRFFFSTNLVISKSKDFKVVKLDFPIQKEVEFWNSVKEDLYITYLNQIETSGLRYNLKDSFLTLPRAASFEFVPPERELLKIPWSISISIFKHYQLDDLEILNECFEFDWRHSRIPLMLRKDLEIEEVKSMLRQFYPVIRASYKTLSAYSGGDLPCVGTNMLTDLLSFCKVFDQSYSINDFGVNWNACIIPLVKNQLFNPGNALVRYEFLEILTRISFDKFVRSKILTSLAQAISCLIQNYLIKELESLSSDSWRINKYRCEEVDICLKAHKTIWESIYKKFTGRKVMPGQKNFMSLDEFRDVCFQSDLVDSLAVREIDVCFYQAMTTQVDEIFCKRHTEMRFLEFLEAITRVCCMKNLGFVKRSLEEGCKKLIRICPVSVQESFVFPNEKVYEKMMYRTKGTIFRSTTLNLLDDSF